VVQVLKFAAEVAIETSLESGVLSLGVEVRDLQAGGSHADDPELRSLPHCCRWYTVVISRDTAVDDMEMGSLVVDDGDYESDILLDVLEIGILVDLHKGREPCQVFCQGANEKLSAFYIDVATKTSDHGSRRAPPMFYHEVAH
jgi:hypothetical protein